MSDAPMKKVRVLTGSVADRRTRQVEEIGQIVGAELTKAGCHVVRHVMVKGEPPNIRALVQNTSTDNEADVVIFIGGTGFGPRDHVCEALEEFYERKIEGFAEAYRRLLRNDIGVHAMLTRATAGIFNQCVVFALTGRNEDVRLAVEVLIAPTLAEAVEVAYGRPAPPREG